MSKKEPRSRRMCLLCGHLAGSHIDVKCLKIVCKDPRIECECKEFVATVEELEIFENRQKLRLLNTLKAVQPEKIQIAVPNFPNFRR